MKKRASSANRGVGKMHGLLMAAGLLAGSAVTAVTIDVVSVGNTQNSNDDTGYGAVDYEYQIGKYEVTAGQYVEFLNAVADEEDTYGLYDGNMDDQSWGCQITRSGSSGSYTYDFSGAPEGDAEDWEDRPVNYVSWGDAARFANWMHNGQPSGAQNDNTTEDGAYDMDGKTSNADLVTISRELDAIWAIPTENEWYKAAYHKNDGDTGNYFTYPTSSDSPPSNDLGDPDPGNNATFNDSTYTVGYPYYRTNAGDHENSESPYGTFDQGGNLTEWNESIQYGSWRGFRGGGYADTATSLAADTRGGQLPSGDYYIGFRLVRLVIPEPNSAALLVAAGALALRRRRL